MERLVRFMHPARVVMFLLIGTLMVSYQPALCARELRVVIFDFDIHATEDVQYLRSGVGALLPSRISIPGSIVVVDQSAINRCAPRNVSSLPLQEKIAVAKRLEADYALTGSITKIGSVISIDAQLLDVRSGRQCLPLSIQCDSLDAIIPQLTEFAGRVKDAIMKEERPQLEEVQLKKKEALSRAVLDDYHETEVLEEETTDEPIVSPSRQRRRQVAKPLQPAFIMPKPLFSKEPVFTYEVSGKSLHALASGDVNGDGKAELLVAGQDILHIFTVAATTLTPCGTISPGTDENIVQIDVGDMNHNGIDEIYVSSYEGHYANSFVLEYLQSEYRRIATSQKLFFRIYTPADDNATLLGQEASLSNPFAGTLYRFEWRDGNLISREEFLAPGSSGIYSFAEGYIDEQEKVYFVFSKGFFGSDYRFSMLSPTGKVLWRDTMNLGGSPNYFIQSMYSDEMQQQQFVPLRIITREFGPKNRLGVIVARNSKKGSGIFKKLMSYNQSEVLCLVWNGTDFVVNWNSGMMQGYTTDYLLADINRDGSEELFILTVVNQSMFGKVVNRISVFKGEQ